jgi:hypothetical protein
MNHGRAQTGQTCTTKRCEKRQLKVVTPCSLLTSCPGKPAKHLLHEFDLEDSEDYDKNEGEDDENEFQDEEENEFLRADQIEVGSNPVSGSSLCK